MIKRQKTLREKIEDMIHYIVGHIRYKLYYSSLYILIPKHIREQIDVRIKSMNPICFANGSCIKCGCLTTQLQMSNKRCDEPCYPTMMNRVLWKNMKLGGYYFAKNGDYKWELKNDIFNKIELEKN